MGETETGRGPGTAGGWGQGRDRGGEERRGADGEGSRDRTDGKQTNRDGIKMGVEREREPGR